mgnify:FL=1
MERSGKIRPLRAAVGEFMQKQIRGSFREYYQDAEQLGS